MSFEAGAAAPLNYLTALFALVRRARAQAGETLLVHGGARGIGTAAIAVGRAYEPQDRVATRSFQLNDQGSAASFTRTSKSSPEQDSTGSTTAPTPICPLYPF
jgi:NADPH2:quinone reductase